MSQVTLDTLPRLAFVSTGGTIAGRTTENSNVWAYESAQVSGEGLLLTIPGLLRSAQWYFEQPYSIGSQNLEVAHMLELRATILRLLASPDIDGVLVTHGTDTMEDMLYFLHLTVPLEARIKPLLFTGAMLPSDHPDADGPQNIRGAFDLVCDALHRGQGNTAKGRMPFGLFMQGLYTPASGVAKVSTAGLDAFDGPYAVNPSKGWLAVLETLHIPEFEEQGAYAHLFDSEANRHPLFESMEVPVVYCTPGNGPLRQLTDLLNRKPTSVIVAAPGHGNIPDACVPALRRLLLNGVNIVRASRVPAGGVVQGGEFSALDEFRQSRVTNQSGPNGQVVQTRSGVFVESGDLSLNQCAIRERLRALALSLDNN